MKKKASELVQKITDALIESGCSINKQGVIKCALISVDGKIETLLEMIGLQRQLYTSYEAEALLELQTIKAEIKKL